MKKTLMKHNPQKLGKTGEERARWALKEIGAKCIYKLATPSIFLKGKQVFTEKTPCDFIAITQCGCYHYPAFIEVKLCDGDKLLHSRLQSHQIKALQEWNTYYADFAFVMWIHKSDYFLIKYPSPYFKEGESLDLKTAKEIAFKTNLKKTK